MWSRQPEKIALGSPQPPWAEAGCWWGKGLQRRYYPLPGRGGGGEDCALPPTLALSCQWALPASLTGGLAPPGASGRDFPLCHPARGCPRGCGSRRPEGTRLGKVAYPICPHFPRLGQGQAADRTCQWGEGEAFLPWLHPVCPPKSEWKLPLVSRASSAQDEDGSKAPIFSTF